MTRQNKKPTMKRFVFHSSCQGKRKYKNENEAKRVAEIQMLENTTLELAVYKCNECAYWHLTRRSNN